MDNKFVTIIILVDEDYDIGRIKSFITEINQSNSFFVELFVIYTSKVVNRFIVDLNIDLPMTVIKNDQNLPDFYKLGLGNTKYLIDNNATSKVERKNNHQVFVGRRANIIFK